MKRALRAFGAFWWDFLVGETPEFLFVAGALIGLAYLVHAHRMVGVVLLPVVTLLSVAASAWRVKRR